MARNNTNGTAQGTLFDMTPPRRGLMAPAGPATPTPAEVARDRGIATVTNNAADWMPRAQLALPPALRRLSAEFTGEQLRSAVAAVVGEPHHHNAWGALVRWAVSAGYVTPTGRWEKGTTEQGHARKLPVYRRRGEERE